MRSLNWTRAVSFMYPTLWRPSFPLLLLNFYRKWVAILFIYVSYISLLSRSRIHHSMKMHRNVLDTSTKLRFIPVRVIAETYLFRWLTHCVSESKGAWSIGGGCSDWESPQMGTWCSEEVSYLLVEFLELRSHPPNFRGLPSFVTSDDKSPDFFEWNTEGIDWDRVAEKVFHRCKTEILEEGNTLSK